MFHIACRVFRIIGSLECICPRGVVLAAIAAIAVSPAASGQGLTGQISGSIHDPSGRAVPAIVMLTNAETGQVRIAKTNERGDFVLPEILPCTFTLSVDVAGFKKFTQTGIVLTASERMVLNSITLELGDVNETVSVETNAEQLQTESAERSGLLDSRQIQELSLKGRDYLAMLKLLPGILDINDAVREAPGGSTLQGIYINGNRQGSINLTLDGISTMDTGGGTGPYMQASIDAVAEVKVLSANYRAEYGRSSGGTINTITKSGTKELHGGAYYYLRNEALNANEFFANRQGLARAQYRFNYPGYFVGGPVILTGTEFNRNRDKLFFFWSEEFLPRTYPSNLTFQTFPQALERTGDFSRSVDQNGERITIKDPLANAPFPGNVVPKNRIDTTGQALLNLFPLPNTFDPNHAYNYAFRSSLKQPRNDQILRVDWNISSRNQFYARGIQDYQATEGGFGFILASLSWPQLPISYRIRGKGVVSTLIHTFSPAKVNEVTWGVNRGRQTVAPLSPGALASNVRSDLNLPQFFPQSNPFHLIPNATFGGVPNAPQLNVDQRFPYFGANTVWEYSDNYSQISGPHNLKLGFYVDRSTKNSQLASSFNGTFAFDRDANNPLDTGYAFSNALIGSVDSYSESTQHPVARARDTSVEWYGQDTWKTMRRLTIDGGVRFYWIDPTSNAGKQLAAFDRSVYNPDRQPPLIQPYIDPLTGIREGRDPVSGRILPAVKIGSFSSAGTPNQGMTVYNSRILKIPAIQVAPRIGFAWDVFGTGKTAIRSGFGIFYDRFPQNQVGQFAVEPPLVNTPAANYTAIANLLSTPLSLGPSTVYGIQRDYKPPAVYNWSFGIQQSLGFGTALSVAYVGDVSRHGMQIRDLNATSYGTNFLTGSIDTTLTGNRPLPANFLRPIQGYASIAYMEFASNSNYNALQAELSKRFSSRFIFHASYTWSKVLDVAETPATAVNPILNYRSRNYGPAAFDRRQNLVLSYVYTLPSLSSYWNNKFSRQAFDGWEISSIASFIGGAPTAINYTFVIATDITGANGMGIDSRVDLICDPNLPRGQRTFYSALNTSCAQPPSKGELGIGNASKYPFVGPGVENFDISLFKNLRLGSDDAKRLQFRFETYNSLNHTQFTTVDNNARFDSTGHQVNRQFGQYTAAAPARRVVLGLKLYF